MNSHAFVDEIIIDLLNIDPDLKNIKSELEKLVQELIKNKPQTPFTKEFKDSLKAQIIGAINEQKILYEEKKWDRNTMLHSLKFWMIGVSTVTAGLLMFTLFHYIEDFQQPTTQIVYKEATINNTIVSKESFQNQPKVATRWIADEAATEGFGGGASNRADNVIMLTMPESSQSLEETNESYEWYAMMAKIGENSDSEITITETWSDKTTEPVISPTFCETSKQFLTIHNLSDTSDITTKTFVTNKTIQKTTKDFTYDNQIYQAIVDYTNNNITIKHIGTQDNNKIQTETPNLTIFFKSNNFIIESDYSSPIIEETDTYFEYYYPRRNNQEGITVRIDKTNNIIFSIQNICVY